ncbi:MAG: Lrp/AsnC family transcriptional regulator [Proteobacteria bacterium]|nr:MAG: Lrp/AsnC family transcriptional regulator [Pseudomonadota bacterium]
MLKLIKQRSRTRLGEILMALRNGLPTQQLDETDLKILKLLSQDAKASYADLGSEVHLTAAAVHGRVKKLERNGIIKRYGIEMDYDVIGLPVIAFVRVTTGKTSCRESSKKLVKFEEIVECHAVAGEDDLMLKTRTATPLDLQNLLDRLKIQGLIERSVSMFVLETQFERARI